MKPKIIKFYTNLHGINDMLCVQVVSGFLVLAAFHGKSALTQANRFIKHFTQSPNPSIQ